MSPKVYVVYTTPLHRRKQKKLTQVSQYPTEFVKTQRQLRSQVHLSTGAIIRNTYATSGFRGFYAGCGVLSLSNALKSGVRFYSFASAQSYLTNAGLSGSWLNATAGLCAGIVESIAVVTPGEALKTRMIQAARSPTRTNLSTFGPIGEVIRTEGVLALWKGIGPVVCKQGTNSAVRFATFASLKDEVAKRWPGKESLVGVTLCLGAISGIVTV
jgi:solute carrier family 25 citrate transporter 1